MLNKFLEEIDTRGKSGIIKKSIIMQSLKRGKASIPEIAKELDLSVPTITKYVTELCDNGYMSDFGKSETSEGRHPSIYGVNSNFSYFIGVDIQNFQLSLMLINFSGEDKKFALHQSFRFSNTVECFNNVCEHIEDFIAEVPIDPALILGININIFGRINTESGFSFTIFNFKELPLADIFTERFGIKTTIENDTRAMTYAEHQVIYKESIKNMIFINVGWGLGSGLVFDEKLYLGKSGFAGEFGHTSFVNNEIMCQCGKKGCLETEVSGSALHRELLSAITNGATSVLSDKVRANKEVTLVDILNAIDKEDTLCIELFENIGQKLGHNIANLINLLNPERIVIGGTLSTAGDYLLQPIKSAIRKHALNIVSRDSVISLSKLGTKSGIIGACLIARMRVFEEQ